MPLFAGTPLLGPVHFVYAIYYSGKPLAPPLAALNEVLGQEHGKIKLAVELPKTPAGPVVQATLDPTVAQGYKPPDMQMIKYFGRGLSREQGEALQLSELALVLEFKYPADVALAGLRAADRVALQVAEKTGGLIWDEASREIYTPVEWRSRRINSWAGDIPDVRKHTVIHSYSNDGMVRAVTLGMGKFGLPDIVVNDFAWSENRPIGNLINALSQSLVEGKAIGAGGFVDLDLRAIRHDAVRTAQTDSLLPSATSVAKLALYIGRVEQGDPINLLAEIGFERYAGPDLHARQSALIAATYGSADGVSMVRHDDAVLAASAAAKARLPALRRDFNAGLRPGEYILVKAPFRTPDGGHEWMWVEVAKWGDKEISGTLNNQPAKIPTLRAGQNVTVAVADIFDYIRYDPSGKEEGNESGKAMLRQQAGK